MNLAGIVDYSAGDRIALWFGAESMTYLDLRRAIDFQAAVLVERGLRPGDRVGLVATNSPSFVIGAFAALRAGLVLVPLNPDSPPAELAAELRHAETSTVLVDPVRAFNVAAVAALTRVEVDPGKRAATVFPMVNRRPEHPAIIYFTSGTAGLPRPAVLSHGNLLANIEQVAAHQGAELHPSDVVLAVAPCFHIFGGNAVLHPALAAGAQVVLVDHFDPVRVLETVGARGVTVMSGPPVMWSALARGAAMGTPIDLSRVRLAVSGAAPLDAGTAVAVENHLGLSLRQGYGLTEAGPVVAVAVGTNAPPSAIGVPVPGLEVRLVDDLGEDVFVGDEGELWVRGPNVFAGYLNDPDTTRSVLTADGWLRTGDIGVVDDDGILTLVDRSKDMIIVSGFNVHPGEVEAALLAHLDVEDAVVTGHPSSLTGERVDAAVVVRTGASATEAELIEHCKQLLIRYKCPSSVRFVQSIDRGITGKVLRRSLDTPGH